MKSLSIDLETRSSVDIGKSGVYRYTEAEDVAILLFGYSVDGREVQVVDLANYSRNTTSGMWKRRWPFKRG